MKILYILTKSGIGGAQKYVKDLAENLDKNKFEAKIIYGGVESRWLSNKTYPWLFFINDWLAVFELLKIFKLERPDIVHSNSSKAGVIGAIAAKLFNVTCHMPARQSLGDGGSRVAVVFTAHGWVFNHTNELKWLVRLFYIFLHKIAGLFTDKIICVSGYDYNLALEYDICEPEKLVKIHNGIDANMKFLSKKEARNRIMNNELGIKNKNWSWIGSIGRLVKEKNYETFIGAAKLIPNAYFFIIGEGPEFKNLKLKIKNFELDDRFFIVPPTGNDAQYLKAFDVFAMSSVKEGLPYILLEAMAAELPIVITEAGGMPELIKNHENGLMVAQRSPEALARAIGGLIENKVVAKELSLKAKEVVKERFSLKKMVSETEKVYNH
ncbi:MAG: glycosyltransferase family 4 protein [bacterium]|nr:glycosyltransferase family 4 protein [bacterium]